MVPVSLPPSSPRIEFHPGDVIAPKGFWADGLNAGLRDQSLDMALLVSQESATFSGMFTTNAVRAAPVELSRAVHQQGLCRAIIINSKNANALTGALGTQDAQAMQAQVARELALDVGDVAVASTGVIGWPLPMDRVRAGIFQLAARFREGDAGDGGAAAQAILTTDTATKTAACTVALSGGAVTIGMMAKGSGMIHPQMATMLAFFTTDAVIAKGALDACLHTAVERSFHRVSVDGDQSTNDMALMWANGASGVAVETADDMALFARGLTELAVHGARLIAADGEGANHLLSVCVSGASSEADAAQKARAIVCSSLVKTAVYGGDPNWGRVLAAAGTVGVAFAPERVSLFMNEFPLFLHGEPVVGQDALWSASMDRPEIEFRLDLAQGREVAYAYGCDLTDGYVEINAHYRT